METTTLISHLPSLPCRSQSKLNPFPILHAFPSSSSVTRRLLLVKARSSSGGTHQQKQRKTLSEIWDPLCGKSITTAPVWMPSFEELDSGSMLLKQRIVFLGSQVDQITADLIISQLLLLDAEDQKKDIKMFINSPGGSVTAGMGIYDAMKLCKADVSTVCFGLAASMGAFLLAAGSKGKRYCMPNARVMIHQPLGTAGGKTTDMGIQIREMMYHKVKMNKILSRIIWKPEHQIEMDTDRNNSMNPWEAKEYGLVDAVIDDGKPGLIAPIADSKPPPKSRVWGYWKIKGSKKAKKNLPTKFLRIGSMGKRRIAPKKQKKHNLLCLLYFYTGDMKP